MVANPYESPRESSQPSLPWRWGRLGLISLAVSAFAFATLFIAAWLKPYDVLGDGPSTPERRATAGVLLVVQMIFYAGLGFSFVAALKWLSKLPK